ncbi:MAG: PD40 domain-containing protein [Bacteroidales bacterium]|nr:PD40 domain-containing protein [Bacteroidales bacterium]
MKHRITLFFIALMAISQSVMSQDNIKSGDEAFSYGYYKTAVDYYLAAYKSSPQPQTAYKIAESYRLSHDYSRAIKYYSTVVNSPATSQFPHCEYFLASMYRNNGQADSALLFYQRYLQSSTNEELEKRARQEARACQWVLDSLPDTNHFAVYHEGKNINTEFSESGAVMMGDSLLLFSSMREISKPGSKDAIYSDLVLMQIFESDFSGNQPNKSTLSQWGINNKEKHSCNVAIDPLHDNIYFTICQPDDFSDIPCDIYVMHRKNGKWQKPKKLGGNINLDGYNTTHPTVGYLPDSTTILYFASNRPGGMGEFDIWYSIIKDGKTPADPVNLGAPVNTPGNEITPFYDNNNGRLYFSSDWHLGFGGYDVFMSEGMRDSWQEPANLGATLNSPANDLYFTVNYDMPKSGYLTSNRKGSYFISDNTCCNDIYSWKIEQPKQPRRRKVEEPIVVEQKKAIHHLLPIKLYFHNDEPDPKSKIATTTTNYFQTYNRYMFMRNDYKRAHTLANGNVVYDSICDAIDYFFDYDVQYNCERFEQFLNLLLEDLKAGHRICMTVEGYASPIHTSKYNELISKRRIASIVNQIMEYKKGILTKFMGSASGSSLQIREIAYGSSHADHSVSADRKQTNKSVYSVEAAKERRIEILDYQYLEDDSSMISCLHLPTRAMHIGTYFTGEYADIQVNLNHTSLTQTTLDFISVGSPDVKVVGYSKLVPGRQLTIYLRMDNRKAEPTVSSFLPITLRVSGEQVTQTMFLEYTLDK